MIIQPHPNQEGTRNKKILSQREAPYKAPMWKDGVGAGSEWFSFGKVSEEASASPTPAKKRCSKKHRRAHTNTHQK